MIELKSDRLVMSFPEVHPDAELTVDFQRTLRIPDDGRSYPLPPGLGSFPLRHLDDHAERVPEGWLKRGGVLLPMWQSEALWLRFSSRPARRPGDPGEPVRGALSKWMKLIPPDFWEVGESYPLAVKVATGKINAITGESWRSGLSRRPQSYLVVPEQPWLDGYCVEKGTIRQFVAMPLGEGYSVEEQITGEAEFGGLQLEVFPMRREVFDRRFSVSAARLQERACSIASVPRPCEKASLMSSMGLAPGGRMTQEIFRDPYSIEDWDTEHGSRCFVHLVNSLGWQQITGTKPPSKPPTAKQYTEAGYPWFDYYDAEAQALDGSSILAGVKSVKAKGEERRQTPLPENESVVVANIRKLRADLGRDQVREGAFE